MSIKKEVTIGRHSHTLWGYTDIGANIRTENEQELATKVLVQMIVGVNDNFKIPIGYFFTNKISGKEKANIILEALKQLSHVKFKILSITCGSSQVNFKLMRELGCKITNPNNLKNYFLHPTKKYNLYIIFDVCPMLKLVRNNWA